MVPITTLRLCTINKDLQSQMQPKQNPFGGYQMSPMSNRSLFSQVKPPLLQGAAFTSQWPSSQILPIHPIHLQGGEGSAFPGYSKQTKNPCDNLESILCCFKTLTIPSWLPANFSSGGSLSYSVFCRLSRNVL